MMMKARTFAEAEREFTKRGVLQKVLKRTKTKGKATRQYALSCFYSDVCDLIDSAKFQIQVTGAWWRVGNKKKLPDAVTYRLTRERAPTHRGRNGEGQ